MRAAAPSNESDRLISVLREWAALGAQFSASQKPPDVDWAPVDQLINAARAKLRRDAQELKRLLDESRKRLDPVGDPFDIDVGSHRWLKFDREEAYSDWLAWIVADIKETRTVYQLFGIEDLQADLDGPPSVQREEWVLRGHVDQLGRLDLVVRYGDRAVIAVELKCTDADSADTAKHVGYGSSLEQLAIDKKNLRLVLIATSAEKDEYDDFTFHSWAKLCITLRRVAASCCGENATKAALILAFVAAVEQNLLRFSAKLVRDVCIDKLVMFNPAVIEQLRY